MGVEETEWRLDVARRLKAARWVRGQANAAGKPTALPIEKLVELDPLRQNGLTANRLHALEQLRERPARPMELRAIIRALSLPDGWFGTASLDPGDEPQPDPTRAADPEGR